MPLGSWRVQKARIVVNSHYSNKDFLLLHGWSKQKIKQRFESAMASIKYRDHRTYAQALCSNNVKGHKKVCKNTQHTNIDTELPALKQLVSTVSNRHGKEYSVNNTNRGHVRCKQHCQQMATLSVNSWGVLLQISSTYYR